MTPELLIAGYLAVGWLLCRKVVLVIQRPIRCLIPEIVLLLLAWPVIIVGTMAVEEYRRELDG